MKQKRILVVGAHPDDPDLQFGGTAALMVKAGHLVKFVSMTNGNSGHQSMEPDALAARRKLEAAASCKTSGIVDYQVLDNPDARLENTIANRELLMGVIRDFQPDVVLSHRLCDYHPDHRTTAQLVLDTSFLVGVPLFCRDHAVPPVAPVYGYTYDAFTDPRPIRPDAVINISSVVEEKLKMIACHESQFFEWLPWCDFGLRDFDVRKLNKDEIRTWLMQWLERNRKSAELAKADFEFAEIAELSPYGRQVSPEEFNAFFQV